jgi:hypothetical protein
LFLLLLGSSLLFLSYFISTGHMEGDSSQVYGLLFLGILAFLPGTLTYIPSVSILRLICEFRLPVWIFSSSNIWWTFRLGTFESVSSHYIYFLWKQWQLASLGIGYVI